LITLLTLLGQFQTLTRMLHENKKTVVRQVAGLLLD